MCHLGWIKICPPKGKFLGWAKSLRDDTLIEKIEIVLYRYGNFLGWANSLKDDTLIEKFENC